MCSLSIAQKISIGHMIGRLSVSVHWRVTIWNKQTKLTIFGRFLFSLIITRAIILKQLFVSGSVNIGEYSTRLIFTNIYNQVSRFRPQPRIPTWSTENWHIAGYLFHFYFSVFRACAVILESKVVGWTASLFWEHLKPPWNCSNEILLRWRIL